MDESLVMKPNLLADDNDDADADHPPSLSPLPPPSGVPPASFAAASVETSPQGQTSVDAPADDHPASTHPASTRLEKETKRGRKRKGKEAVVEEGIQPRITAEEVLSMLPIHKRIYKLLSEGRMIEKEKGKSKLPFAYVGPFQKTLKKIRTNLVEQEETLKTITRDLTYLLGKLLKKKVVMEIVPEEDKGYKGSSEKYGGEEGDVHKEEAKEGDDDNKLSRFSTMEEDEKGAKNVDDVDDKYSSEIQRQVMDLKKCIRDDDCLYKPLGKERADYDTWIRYKNQIDDSEGFDIKSYPGDCFMARIVPLRDIQNDPEYIQWGIKSLEDYNAKTAIASW